MCLLLLVWACLSNTLWAAADSVENPEVLTMPLETNGQLLEDFPATTFPFDAQGDELFMFDPADDQPLGVTGSRQVLPDNVELPARRPGEPLGGDFFPVEDRWRLGFPAWDRYVRSSLARPYRQSVLKGDYPWPGTQDIFSQLTVFSDSLFLSRDVANAAGKVNQHLFQQTVFVTADLFRGDNTFHPSEWFLTVTPAYRLFDLSGVDGVDDFTLQQGFLDYQIAITTDYYDEVRVRLGRQAFASDFLGFVFADANDAARLFWTNDSKRTFGNLVFFNQVQKDPVSNLNTFDARDQQIAIATLQRNDFIFPGFNALSSFVYDHDDFKNQVDAFWLELAFDGRLGRLEVSGAAIQALGNDTANAVAGRPVHINAQFAALELVLPLDWIKPKISALYASGDKNPRDGVGRGFDSVFDNPNFAGNGFAYLNREAMQIGGVRLSNGFSFLPNLRNKLNDPMNSVNPGLVLLNAGVDTVLTTQLVAQANVNFYQLAHSESVAQVAGLPSVGKDLGWEINAGLIYKPLIVDNVVFSFGGGVLEPGAAITDLNGGDDRYLYTAFSAATLVY